MNDYERLFGAPADPEATKIQDAKHTIGEAKRLEALRLQQLAALNTRYANALEETAAKTGRDTYYMANLHRTCAAQHLAQAEAIYPPDNTALYDSAGQRG